MTDHYDVIIVGAGSAGLTALREVKKRGMNWLLVNDGPWGTTCARVGCMPSKLLIEAANAWHRRTAFDEFGITGADRLSLDLPAVLRRVRRLRDGFVAGARKATDTLGERAVAGRARLHGPGRLVIDDREVTARSIVLAPGSRPVVPDAWRALGDRLLTTDTLFEQDTLPRRMAVIGLGAVGTEMALALSRLGTAVTAFGGNEWIGGLSDPHVNAAAAAVLGDEMTVHRGSRAEPHDTAEGIRVRADGQEATVDAVLAALGRRPNTDNLGLETLGVPLDAHGLPVVDPHTLRVGDLPIFLAGDANGHAPLLHEAADEGHIAGINAARLAAGDNEPACFTRRTPLAIVFSEPGIAVVGRRWRDLDATETASGEVDFTHQGRARAAQRNRGTLRVYAARDDGRLQGAEMCAPAAEHLAHLLALAIGRGLTVADLLRLPFYHPVLEEGLRSALRDLAKQLPGGSQSDLAGCQGTGIEALD